MLKHSPTQFSRTFREGDKIFIIQLGSNVQCIFLLIFELILGQLKGSIVIPEGKLGRGWRGFGLHLRKTLEASLLRLGHPRNQKGDHKQPALVMAEGRQNNYGTVNKGKEKILEFQISKVKNFNGNHNDFHNVYSRKEKVGFGAKVTSVINGIVSNDMLGKFTLDFFFCVVQGFDGSWDVVFSEVKEVGLGQPAPVLNRIKPVLKVQLAQDVF